MKGLGDSRPRHLSDSLDPPHEPLFAGPDRNPYLLSPTEAFAREARFPGQNALPGDGLFPLNNQLPPPSSTFPRIHYNSHFEVPEESPFPSHAQATKINRLPANLLDQFEKQLPIHRDGFSTLQFPRGEAKARGESPGRIRHLVHSVQRLFFTKAPSLEGTAGKVGGNGGKKGVLEDGKGRRAKSKERAKAGEPKRRSRSNISGWWSSDDNLDSDSGFLAGGRPPGEPGGPFCLEAPDGSYRDLSFRGRSGGSEGRCLACTGVSMSLDGQAVKRSAWHTMVASQGRDGHPGAGPSKGLLGPEAKAKARTYHYLQVRLWWGWGTGSSALTSVVAPEAVEGVGWEPALPMMTGLEAAGSPLPHCLVTP